MTPRATRRGRTAPETQPTEHEAPWTRAAARMGAVTAVSRGFGFLRVLVDRRGARHDLSRQRVPSRELRVERAVRARRGRVRCRPCWCRRSSNCSTRATTKKRTGSRRDCSGSRSSASASSLSSASSAHRCSPAADRGRGERRGRRRSNARWRPTCCAGSCRSCCSTRAARSRPACSTHAGDSRSPPPRRSATPSSWSRRSSRSASSPVPTRPSCSRLRSSCSW